MRPAFRFLLVVLIVGVTLSTSAQVVTLQVMDVSAPGSPIHVSGNIIVAESIESSPRCARVHAAQCSVLSERYAVTLENVSEKPIAAYVAEMQGRTSHASYIGGEYRAEKIFGDLFEPDSSESWPGGGGVQIHPQTADAQPAVPELKAQVRFVQFSDGTIFGDPKTGESLLLTRQKMLERLAQLDGIYRREGEDAFVKALAEPSPGARLIFPAMAKQLGPSAALDHLRRMLATAKQRLAAMTAQPGR